ncbi:hypothetical protein HBI56_045080 [Parastagonospora nodorum]|nr:hypothetical protein HBH52_111230 [Parastagonospora nodorum]KAH4349004.1 hypothetical protein HBH98_075190 [Parastagonospora nodorum]KAH4381356.1 hypothetical protein HBH99_192840 [Parastagonospora nodorum]KAH4391927.1 hypothetical protein HBH97_042840 [Parastagonospora nodorum]KAH4418077.1 hypothetical protein HBH92_054690 [Parastagonospora nodorum]
MRIYAVKLSGHENDNLMIVGFQPKYNSAIKNYALFRDPFDLSMGDAYSKIVARNHVFDLDIFMRRADERILRGDGESDDLNPMRRAAPRSSQKLVYRVTFDNEARYASPCSSARRPCKYTKGE